MSTLFIVNVIYVHLIKQKYKNMTNLLERLKPEHKQSLDRIWTPYPTTKGLIEQQLTDNKFVSELNFATIDKLSEVLGVSKFGFTDIYDMFEQG